VAFQTSLSNQYTHLYNEISRLDEKSGSTASSGGRESSPDLEWTLLASQIKNFIKARIALVKSLFLAFKTLLCRHQCIHGSTDDVTNILY